MCEEGIILTGHRRRMRVVYSRLRAALQGRWWRSDGLRRTGKPLARFPRARRMRPKQQQARETINPVTGLIHQVRKCLAACAAAYIVRRPWGMVGAAARRARK